ncbi:hypothetical protein [Actinoplanes sp. NPDC051411]|uniref:hypothetical protein n=1 Tax=Actinoplanes sp. NPDC051411 TaxID=3155522 RepID=UPI003430921C
MPIEDPRRDGSKRDGLRIGGWLETFQARRALPGRPPLVTPPPPRVPVFYPVRPRETGRRPQAMPVFAQVEDPRQVRLRVAVTCLVALAVGGTAFVVLADRAGTAPPVPQIAVADPVTLGPMPLSSPSSSSSPSRSPSHSPTPARTPSSPSSSPHHKAPAAVHHSSPAPVRKPSVIGGLRVGGTLSLVSRGRWGTSFVVHAAGDCVTLESARHPGFYLHAQDSALRFERSGGSAFCPVPAGDGRVRLRADDRYVTAFRSRLFLAAVPASRAAEFAPS